MDDDVEIPFQFRNMLYEQCFGKGTMSDHIRENFNWMFSENNSSYESVLHDDYIDDHKNTDNAWISAKAIAFELNFEADFDTSENRQPESGESDTKCSLNGSNKGV